MTERGNSTILYQFESQSKFHGMISETYGPGQSGLGFQIEKVSFGEHC